MRHSVAVSVALACLRSARRSSAFCNGWGGFVARVPQQHPRGSAAVGFWHRCDWGFHLAHIAGLSLSDFRLKGQLLFVYEENAVTKEFVGFGSERDFIHGFTASKVDGFALEGVNPYDGNAWDAFDCRFKFFISHRVQYNRVFGFVKGSDGMGV